MASSNKIVGTPNNTSGHDFDFIDIDSNTQLDLRYVGFIDLEKAKEREYKYAMSYVLGSNDKRLVGKVLLVPSDSAKYWSTDV